MKRIALLMISLASLTLSVNAQYSKSTYSKSGSSSQTYKSSTGSSSTYRSQPYGSNKGQQANKKPVGDNTIYDSVDEMASYPGGKSEMYQFMKSELQYPQEAKDKKIQGRVLVDFVINRDGSIQDVKVKQSVDPLLDAEAIRMVKAMPKWTAAQRDGKNVRSRYSLPVLFKLK